MELVPYLVALPVAIIAGWAFAHFYTKRITSRAQVERKALLEDAMQEGTRIKEAARSESKAWITDQRESFNKEVREARRETKESERRIARREDSLERKMDLLNKKEKKLGRAEESQKARELQIHDREQELEQLVEEEKSALYRITEMSRDEAERILLERIEKDLEHEKDLMISRLLERVKEKAEERAQDILATSIQRCASQFCQQVTVSSIELPNDEMKGRIIGREGRNIRAFEKATGVDVIVDDTPGVITLSCFDSIRREMAVRSLEKLIADGRIHPTRIEEVVSQTKQEMNELIQKTGKQVSYDLDIPRLHPKIVTLLGRLRFRTSYGQNVLQHSIECSNLAGMIAAEL
ncbi:MAG: Rnase Y domain-containing protein, partial [Planctomycetota bacterium]